MSILGIVILIVLGIFTLCTVLGSFFTVDQQTASIVQRFGKFVRIANSGLNFKIPWIDWIAGDVSLRVEQLDVKIETKTKDNVFVTVTVAVQNFVIPEKVYDAFYKLEDPTQQITSFVFDVIRAEVPKLDLDDVFEKKDDIAKAVKEQLAETMDDFGYGIVKTLVTDIDPDAKVKAAMNEINTNVRLRLAATEKGEADKILQVKAAEAEAESKKLQGEGIANQRKAIIDGLKASLEGFGDGSKVVDPKEAMQMILLTQYFDALKEIGANSKSNVLLVPHSPSAIGDLSEQIRNSMLLTEKSTGQVA
jgi:regulator of protease activity HflC (stomatin/prohibitin superfamily)